jgi:hypothetical protein
MSLTGVTNIKISVFSNVMFTVEHRLRMAEHSQNVLMIADFNIPVLCWMVNYRCLCMYV